MKPQLSETCQSISNPPFSILKKQLVKEIICLERQMELARELDATDEVRMQTFESMIESRRRMLNNMPWGE